MRPVPDWMAALKKLVTGKGFERGARAVDRQEVALSAAMPSFRFRSPEVLRRTMLPLPLVTRSLWRASVTSEVEASEATRLDGDDHIVDGQAVGFEEADAVGTPHGR